MPTLLWPCIRLGPTEAVRFQGEVPASDCVCRSGTHARILYLFPLSVTTLHTKVMNAAVQSATAIV